MIHKILGTCTSSANIKDQKLVLSLTDALTPAVWIVDLAQNPTLLFKVDETSDGLFVLQKISDGKIDDLGYYKKRGHAIRAMDNATKALQNKGCGFWKSTKMIIIILVLAGVLYSAAPVVQNILSNGMNTIDSMFKTETVVQQAQSPQAAPQPATNPDAVGVPLSADDFLTRRRSTSGMPF